MTLDRFNEYLESFNKRPGEFTEEEMLEICSVFKVFVKGKKGWNDLLDRLGSTRACDAWLHMINRTFRAFPDYEKKIYNLFSDESVDVKTPRENFIDTQLNVLYKQQTKVRDDLNAFRRNMREEARIESLKETIQSAAKSVETYISSPVKFKKTKNNKIEAILMLSDWHIGALVNNFYNNYNSVIATAEVQHLINQVKEYCSLLNVYQLNILNMGDLIHGGIHTNLRIEQEFDAITQVEVAGQLLYKILSSLEYAAPVVTYRSCSDNHSRLMANKSEHIEKENFGRLIDWWLEAKLEQGKHKNIKVIRDNLDFGLGKFNLLNGKKVMFAHGHEDRINSAYQNFTGATKEFIDYALLAHYHNPKEKTFNDCKVIVNGSLVGTEQYALSKRLFSSPTQKLLIFDKDDSFIDISINTNTRKSG